MKKLIIAGILLLFAFTGCTNNQTTKESDSVNSISVESSSSTKEPETTKESESKKIVEKNESTEDKVQNSPESNEKNNITQQSPPKTSEIESESSTETSKEDLCKYLESKYPVENAHYEVSDPSFNNALQRNDFDIYIISNNETMDTYITGLKDGTYTTDDPIIHNIFNVAGEIIEVLPQEFNDVHIYLVSWIGQNRENNILLIQDYS
ncbi:MAG TPA: hypothetical protein IAC41_05205 [Candidatus Merdenecus merdavium]|nr:hypothetical protein [Candidatus Merdenecus merdavium]